MSSCNFSSKVKVSSVNAPGKVVDSGETFDDFRNKFYTDSAFQLSRIKFPLPKVYRETDDGQNVKPDYLQKGQWELNLMLDKSLSRIETTKSDDEANERITTPIDPTVIQKSRFKKINGKWFLVYYETVGF